jgi:hypothetical protein
VKAVAALVLYLYFTAGTLCLIMGLSLTSPMRDAATYAACIQLAVAASVLALVLRRRKRSRSPERPVMVMAADVATPAAPPAPVKAEVPIMLAPGPDLIPQTASRPHVSAAPLPALSTHPRRRRNAALALAAGTLIVLALAAHRR